MDGGQTKDFFVNYGVLHAYTGPGGTAAVGPKPAIANEEPPVSGEEGAKSFFFFFSLTRVWLPSLPACN